MSLFGLFSGDKKTTNTTENTTNVDNFDNRVAADGGGIALGQGSALDQSIDFTDNSIRDDSVNILDLSNRSTNINDTRDQSVRISDTSNRSTNLSDTRDQSVRISDTSNRSTNLSDSRDQRDQRTFNITNTDAEVAQGAVDAGLALGNGALALVNRGIDAQLTSQREARLLAENSLGVVADTTRANLKDTLSLLGSTNAASLSLADATAARAVKLAGDTSTDVLAFARGIAQQGQDESAAARIGAEKTIETVLASKEAGDTKVAQDLIRYGAIAASIIAAAFILFRSKKAA